MEGIKIRPALLEDAEKLLDIYSYYVNETAVTFEWELPSREDFCNRIKNASSKFSYLVCEDLHGNIIGYVYASTFSPRKAYDWTVETSIYLRKDARRKGIGTELYKALENELKAKGIVNLIAKIAWCDKEDEYLTHDSVLFHRKCGYENAGTLKGVGFKFDRWYDIVMMVKKL